jgi:hypothetical protein
VTPFFYEAVFLKVNTLPYIRANTVYTWALASTKEEEYFV